jgi:hypothetical protein
MDRQLKVTAEELKAAFSDWQRTNRRFNRIAKNKRHPESIVDAAARASDKAFTVVDSLLRRATGAKRHQACAVVLPDGSHLVAVTEPASLVQEKSAKLVLVPIGRVARLA